MNSTRSLKTLMIPLVLAVGCHSAPKQRPQILSSRPPAGAPQAPPLNSRQPIDVPSAPVMRPQATATVVTPVPALQAGPPPAGYLVPAQPGPQPQAQAKPAPDFGEFQPPATNSDQRPSNPNRLPNNAPELEPKPRNSSDASRPLIAPNPSG